MSAPVKPYRVPPPASPGSFHSTSNMVQARRGEDDAMSPDVEATKDYAFFHSPKFKICFLSMCFNVVLFALDQFIITVAVPEIVSEFDALDQVEWLNTGIMTIASPRWTYLAAVFIFEIGSAICGSAKSMNMLIAGRAVTGLGGAGMWNATFLIGGEVIPFDKRPGFFGLFGVSYIFASVMGPLVGGALTDAGNSGWRWCFYINLPIGAITLVLLFLTLPSIPMLTPFDGKPDHRLMWQKLVGLDWISAVLTLGFVTCLGVGLQWGGITKPWNDAGVIATLVLALVLFVALMGWSVVRGPKAMIPMSLLSRRHFSLGIWVSFFGYGSIVVYLYYIPLFFEAILDKTAVRAGVLLLGFQLTMCPLLIIVGKLGERTGQAKITILLGFALVAVASGLLTLISKSSSIAQLVGFEAIAGVGYGSVLNIVVLLVQADYLKTPHLVPHVTNVLNFWGFVGRIVGMSTATNIFENKASNGVAAECFWFIMLTLEQLRKGLGAMSTLNAEQIAEVSASPKAIWEVIPSELRDEVLDIYSSSLNNVWWLCLAFAIAGLVSAALMRNLNLKQLAEEAGKSVNEANPPAYPLERVRDDKQSSASAEGSESQRGFDHWKGA